MSKLSREFIVGGVLGYFFSNNFFIFGLGIATGIIVQEKFGSVYRFTQFTYESASNKVNQYLGKFNNKPPQIFNADELNNLKDKEE